MSWQTPPAVPLLALSRVARNVFRVLGKACLVLVAVTGLLLPGNRVSQHAYPLLFGIPILVAVLRRGAGRDLLLWASYALAFVSFSVLRNYADETGVPWFMRYPIAVDRMLGFGSLPTVWLQSVAYHPGVSMPWDWYAVGIHLSYYLVPPLVGVILWVADRDRFERYMVAAALTYLGGVVVHFLVPTAPPWMAAKLGLTAPVHRILYDLVHGQSPSFYQYGSKVAAGNEVAAMPSLHMALAWLAWLSLRPLRKLGLLSGAYALSMAVALVYLGEHYVADLLGGMALASGAWLFTGNVAGRIGPSLRDTPDLVTTLAASTPEDMPAASHEESARREP